ncbi:MAG: SpoIIE family protein phosphatase [bacterium]
MPEDGDWLELTSPGQPARRLALEKARVLIGRVAECDVQLTGSYVSRRHARMERGPEGHWRIIDLGSSNGTFVNGRRAQVAHVADGDVVAIGTYRLTLRCAASRDLSSEAPTAMDSDREIVPSGGGSLVVDHTDLGADRVVPARLLVDAHEAGRRLSRAHDIPSLLDALAREFHTILHPRRLAVGREDAERVHWPVVRGPDGGPAGRADLSRLLVPRVEALQSSLVVSWDELATEGGSAPPHNAAALLFPIAVGGRRLGHVYAELDRSRRQAPEEAIDLLALLARQAALIWENLQLQGARSEAEELSRELSAARDIQLRLFPEREDLDPRLDIAAQNVPALRVSGDYYDFQACQPGRVAFVLADVMGHGMSAALLMASVQAVFRTGVRSGWELSQIDRRVHELVAASGQGETFVTGILGVCDLTQGQLALLSAGHPWPSIRLGDHTPPRDPEACAPPWGVPADRTPSPTTVPLSPEPWSLVAYTDGLPETLTPDGTPYGTSRLTRLHREVHPRSADAICERILADVLAASDAATPQQDDMTLLVLRSAEPHDHQQTPSAAPGAGRPQSGPAPGGRQPRKTHRNPPQDDGPGPPSS